MLINVNNMINLLILYLFYLSESESGTEREKERGEEVWGGEEQRERNRLGKIVIYDILMYPLNVQNPWNET